MNYLDAHPDEAAIIAGWRFGAASFAPFVTDGRFGGGVRFPTPGAITIPKPVTAEDYVVGLELLGYRFAICRMRDAPAVFMKMPDEPEPEAFDRMFLALREAFGPGRMAEVIAFLAERDGGT